MSPEELEAKILELSTLTQVHTELLLSLVNQSLETNAQLEAALAAQREILFKMGISKEETAKRQSFAHNAALVVAYEKLKPLFEKIGQTPGASDEPPPYRN
jgi:hypothetical protein